MKGLRLILFSYCLLAALVGTAAIAVLGVRFSRLGAELRTQAVEIKTLQQKHDDVRDELLALREKQRLERDNYSAGEAIAASANTQVAIEAEARLQSELDAKQTSYDQSHRDLQQRQTQLVPLLAISLLHWLLLPLLFRRRGQA